MSYQDGIRFNKSSASLTSQTSQYDGKISKDAQEMMKKIPKGAEATTVLVGSAEFLEKPIMAFVR